MKGLIKNLENKAFGNFVIPEEREDNRGNLFYRKNRRYYFQKKTNYGIRGR